MGKKWVFCTSCVAFVIGLLAAVPAVFVWNLFLNGQGSFNLVASVTIAASVACVPPVWVLTRAGRERQRR